jgi:hypothetical protein
MLSTVDYGDGRRRERKELGRVGTSAVATGSQGSDGADEQPTTVADGNGVKKDAVNGREVGKERKGAGDGQRGG